MSHYTDRRQSPTVNASVTSCHKNERLNKIARSYPFHSRHTNKMAWYFYRLSLTITTPKVCQKEKHSTSLSSIENIYAHKLQIKPVGSGIYARRPMEKKIQCHGCITLIVYLLCLVCVALWYRNDSNSAHLPTAVHKSPRLPQQKKKQKQTIFVNTSGTE